MNRLWLRSAAAGAVVTALTLSAPTAEACSCMPTDVASSYAVADDAFVARVVFGMQVGQTRWYIARARFTLKGCLEPGEWIYLKTPASSAACGQELSVGYTYYINGFKEFWPWGVPLYSIGSCSYNRKVADLTPSDREWLLRRYNCCGDDCECVDGSDPVQCFVDPCEVASCPAGECTANYCGGCHAEFYDGYGMWICTPCESDADCHYMHHCSVEGQCIPTCSTDDDCADGFWCSPAQAGASGCTPFQQEGEACGGFTPVWSQLKCAPGLICTDFPPFVADAPGVCRKPCDNDKGCLPSQYCGHFDVCRADGECWTDIDCNDAGNQYPHIACLGYGVCESGQCGWTCGGPAGLMCEDVAGVDFGPCKMLLGWRVLDGKCTLLGGCPTPGWEFFPSEAACQQACAPKCEDVSGVDFGACAMVLGVGYVDGECVGVSGCDDMGHTLYESLEECWKACYDPCDDLVGLDFGACDMVLGVGVVDGKCTWLSGCDDEGHPLFENLQQCWKTCPKLSPVADTAAK